MKEVERNDEKSKEMMEINYKSISIPFLLTSSHFLSLPLYFFSISSLFPPSYLTLSNCILSHSKPLILTVISCQTLNKLLGCSSLHSPSFELFKLLGIKDKLDLPDFEKLNKKLEELIINEELPNYNE